MSHEHPELEEEPYYCVKCGARNGMMISKHIYRIKNKAQWDSIDKQVRGFLLAGKKLLLSFTKKGLYIGIEKLEPLDDS